MESNLEGMKNPWGPDLALASSHQSFVVPPLTLPTPTLSPFVAGAPCLALALSAKEDLKRSHFPLGFDVQWSDLAQKQPCL
jgi:hypothetical protein